METLSKKCEVRDRLNEEYNILYNILDDYILSFLFFFPFKYWTEKYFGSFILF